MVRALSDLRDMPLPRAKNLWVALRDEISPYQSDRKPSFAENLFEIKAFKNSLKEVMQRDPLDLSWDDLVTNYRRFQKLRACLSEACGMDARDWLNAMSDGKKVARYPEGFAEELAHTQREIYTYRVRTLGTARSVGGDSVLYKIEKFEPLGIWQFKSIRDSSDRT